MKLLFVHSHIFKYDENNVFFSNGQFPYEILKERYLPYFSELNVAGRGNEIKHIEKKQLNISSGPKVNHFILPNVSSIKNRNRNLQNMKADLKSLIKESDALVARMPSIHAYHAIKIAKREKKPYVIEVVGDVFASLWTHGSIIGKLLAPSTYFKYKSIINKAPYLIYVTKDNLQNKYPHNTGSLVTNISNVDIISVPEEILRKKLKKLKNLTPSSKINIGLIGSYSSKYKGIDTAIRAVGKLNEHGYNCNLIVLGSGDNKWLISLAEKLKINDKITFAGSLPGGREVFEWLDTIDIYIQPSLTEGLPRALIEAMSRALPCVASSAGGIPELIDSKFIHRPKSVKELSEKIRYLLNNNNDMLSQAEINFINANEYTAQVLNERRKEFWTKFKDKELNKK